MTQIQHSETWYKSGPYGSGILDEHFDLTAKTAHSNGPTFGAIYLTHMSEEARRMADARATLCASAPELLQALKAIVNDVTHFPGHFDADSEILEIARAAIAKAEGSR